ncbi:MAG TPA: FAD-dependent oxidoreductase, partial [Myxococcaceae bacterium]|nr:FAD-dependent oxidoreductase [Myxococcaceae bacterium]
MSKSVLCTCEDVTLDDVRHAIDKGYRDIESIKRYTGFGTGVCQGKSCLSAVARTLAERTGASPGAVLPFTPRPPLHPVAMSLLGTVPVDEQRPPLGGVPPVIQVGSHALRPPEPVPARTRVVIIGGGIMGLALAHNLAKLGCTDVLVLEKGYLCAGASGRNGGGVRMQWSTPTNIELARRSIELMKQFAGEMGINVWLRQGGYLFLARTPEVAEVLRSSAELHNKYGVKTQILSPGEGRDVVPELTMKGV